MVTIKDVSQLAKVSPATVSRVLSGSTPVSKDKRVRVERAMEALDYRPNSIAQALALRQTHCIGVVLPSLSDPFYSKVAHYVESALRRLGYAVTITSGGESHLSQSQAIEFLVGRNVDGLLLYTSALSDDDLAMVVNGGLPVVIFNRFVLTLRDRCVYLDNEWASYAMTQYLLSLGHRKIGFVTGPKDNLDSQSRLQGYQRALAEASIRFEAFQVYEGDFTEPSGAAAADALLGRFVTAIFFANDRMAIGGTKALTKRGIKLPDEVSIVGFDDIDLARHITPELTTVAVPLKAMSVSAVQLLLGELGRPVTRQKHQLVPEIIKRQSASQYSPIGTR